MWLKRLALNPILSYEEKTIVKTVKLNTHSAGSWSKDTAKMHEKKVKKLCLTNVFEGLGIECLAGFIDAKYTKPVCQEVYADNIVESFAQLATDCAKEKVLAGSSNVTDYIFQSTSLKPFALSQLRSKMR